MAKCKIIPESSLYTKALICIAPDKKEFLYNKEFIYSAPDKKEFPYKALIYSAPDKTEFPSYQVHCKLTL